MINFGHYGASFVYIDEDGRVKVEHESDKSMDDGLFSLRNNRIDVKDKNSSQNSSDLKGNSSILQGSGSSSGKGYSLLNAYTIDPYNK